MKTSFCRSRCVLLLLFACLFEAMNAQSIHYQLMESEQITPSIIKLTITVYGNNKKAIEEEAKKAALNAVMFDGLPGTSYSKALLDEGLNTLIENHSDYFMNLYSKHYEDYIQSCLMISKFKKADKNKGTRFIVEIKVLNLKKDLEKNHIRKRLGI